MADRSCANKFFLLILTILMTLSACNPISGSSHTVEPNPPEEETAQPSPTAAPPEAELQISLTLLQPAGLGQHVYLEILDDVTGLANNARLIEMQAGNRQQYSLRVPINLGSILKYRYRLGNKQTIPEHTCFGQVVEYRMAWVGGPDSIQDIVCQWKEGLANAPLGRLAGKVTSSAADGIPLPNILVEAGGMHTLTAADGTYLIEGLAQGNQHVFLTGLTNAYLPNQQGALIQQNALTPADFQLTPSKLVEVTFQVSAPSSELPSMPIRIAGNLYSLGYRFTNQQDNSGISADRAPLLKQQADTHYAITLKLPTGYDLRYKYTLGSGLWNSELLKDGNFRLRQLIVPDQNITIQDSIETWQAPGRASITFSVTAPADTPASDVISIQFDPEKNGEVLPMWPLGNNRWYMIMYNLPATGNKLTYRYCRNEQCDTANETAALRSVRVDEKNPQLIKDEIQGWVWWPGPISPEQEKLPKDIHSGLFLTGVEFQPKYQPSWLPYMNSAYQDIQTMNAGWVVLTPAWKYTNTNPPVLESVPGSTPSWSDINTMIHRAQKNRLHVALYPQMDFGGPAADWWQQARRDHDWWSRWFDRYSTFLLHFAMQAEQNGVGALIIGDPALAPAMPGGLLADGSSSGVPANSPALWQGLITEVHKEFRGQIFWALPYPEDLKSVPAIPKQVDQIYLLWSEPLAKKTGMSVDELSQEFEKKLTGKILPLREKVNKPILLAVSYPSISYAAVGCAAADRACIPVDQLNQPFTPSSSQPDFAVQADLYRAIFNVIRKNDYQWISGLVSRGYYPPVTLQDQSLSVRGKPAESVLRSWFEKFINQP